MPRTLEDVERDFDARFKALVDAVETGKISEIEYNLRIEQLVEEEQLAINSVTRSLIIP